MFTLILGLLVLSSELSISKDFNLKKFHDGLPKLLGSNNAGKDFWMTFPPCWETSGAKNDLKIYVSSGVATLITVEVPGKGFIRQQHSIPNDIVEFTLSPAIGQPYRKTDRQAPEPERVYDGFGVHVYAEDPIICYGVTRYQYTSDGYLAIPTSSLGKEYISASWADIADDGTSWGQYLSSYIGITSPFDGNKVRFTLGGETYNQTAGGQLPGETKTYNLYKGDVLLIGTLGQLADFSGSKVKATKPVSVVDGNFCSYVPESTGYCDFMSEMELPTNTWGTQYHVTPIFGRKRNSIIKIFAKEADTRFYRDGQEIAHMKNGGGFENEAWYRMRADDGAPRPVIISGDKPISVTQYNPGQDDDYVPSDPFQMVLTPVEQFQREIIFNTPGIKGGYGFTVNYINIVYRGNDDGSIPDDLEFATVQSGQFAWKKVNAISPQPGLPFRIKVNNHNYFSKTILLPGDGVYKVRAADPFCAYAYGFSDYDSYGFPTSVALGDLEKPDTLAPVPTFMVYCDGFVGSTDGLRKDAVIEDLPRNDDRSNLSMIVFHSAESFNYKFSYLDFIPGETPLTKWRAYVVDPTQDARCVITFSDRRGNDTTIEINYYAVKLSIRPDLNFGLLQMGNSKDMETWLINESTPTANKTSDTISRLELKLNNQNFQIVGVTLPLIVNRQDSVKVKVRFTANALGDFIDSVGTGDSCVFAYKAQVRAKVGNARIDVNFYDYGDVTVGSTANGQLTIKNIGTTELVVSDYTGPRQGTIFVPDLSTITPSTPLKLAPNQVFTFDVIFRPTAEQRYTDSIFFISNTEKTPAPVDSVGDLFGRGIKPGLVANSYDWGRKLITRTAFPTGPYDVLNPTDTIIKLENSGSQSVRIRGINTDTCINCDAFEFDQTLLTGVDIADTSFILVPVKFHPKVTGDHLMVISYDNTAGSTTKTTLRGVGIVPRIRTQDVDFGKTVLWDSLNPSIKKVKYSLLSVADWAYADTVCTVTDFKVNSGIITESLTGFGFRYAKSLLGFPTPIKLTATNPDYEFDAEFIADVETPVTASITSVSDAETEQVSNWTGAGIKQGITVTTGSAKVCKGSTATINCKIENTGQSNLNVNQLVIIEKDPASKGVFIFANPNDAKPFALAAGAFRDVVINYIPDSSSTALTVNQTRTHTADLIAYNDKVNDTVAVNATPLTGQVSCFEAHVSILNPRVAEDIKIGDKVDMSIVLDQLVDITLADLKLIHIEMKYDSTYLKVDKNSIVLGSKLQGSTFAIPSQSVKISDRNGRLQFDIEGTEAYDFAGLGEIAKITMGVYLPNALNQSNQSPIEMVATTPGNDCITTPSTGSDIKIMPTCLFDLRKVVVSANSYELQSVNPNPVSGSNAEIKFSVGLDTYTELRIYNSNSQLVANPVREVLKNGQYVVTLDVSNLPSGAYTYEMTSGPYRKTDRFVIVR